MRLLALIDAAAEPFDGSQQTDELLHTAVGVVRTQVRLQKLDFWVRNPDYLANELLNDYEAGDQDPALLGIARDILESEEPELRSFPMLRWLFGAYEQLDEALSILKYAGLVIPRKRGTIQHVTQHDYFLLKRGRDLNAQIVSDYPQLAWYSTRSALVVQLTSGQGATTLKDRQYLIDEYVDTPYGQRIPSIAEKARLRLSRLSSSPV